jgi:hypothetical protein
LEGARGEDWIVAIFIACVFKKIYEANARWYDADIKGGAKQLLTKTLRQAQGERVNELSIQ